jgi:hypothetical protein
MPESHGPDAHGWPSPDDLAALHALVTRFIRGALAESRMNDEIDEVLELRVAAIEEVLAARGPRRWLLAARLGRVLRASVRHLGWVGPSFAARRAEAASLAVHPGCKQEGAR